MRLMFPNVRSSLVNHKMPQFHESSPADAPPPPNLKDRFDAASPLKHFEIVTPQTGRHIVIWGLDGETTALSRVPAGTSHSPPRPSLSARRLALLESSGSDGFIQ